MPRSSNPPRSFFRFSHWGERHFFSPAAGLPTTRPSFNAAEDTHVNLPRRALSPPVVRMVPPPATAKMETTAPTARLPFSALAKMQAAPRNRYATTLANVAMVASAPTVLASRRAMNRWHAHRARSARRGFAHPAERPAPRAPTTRRVPLANTARADLAP